MTTAPGNRSGDVLIWVSAVILLGVGGSWLVLSRPWADGAPPAVVDIAPEAASDATTGRRGETSDPLEAELARAELAQASGMLLDPPEQSALFLFRDVLDTVPGNPRALAGLAKVRAQISQQGLRAIDQSRLRDARRLLSALGPAEGDPNVTALADRLRMEARNLLALGGRLADEQRYPEATAAVERAASLAMLPAADIEAARTDIEARRQAAAQPEKTQQTVRPADEPKAGADLVAPLKSAFDSALAAGQLLAPQGVNANFFFNEILRIDADDPRAGDARRSLYRALMDRAADAISAADADTADAWLAAADRLNVDPQAVARARKALDARVRSYEANRILPANSLEMIHYVPPVYPPAAQSRGDEGWVEVQFVVTRDGEVRDAAVSDASNRTFQQASLDAVSAWKFKPRIVRGEPVDQRVQARLRFQLTN